MTNIVSGTEYFLLNFSKDQRGTRYRRRVIFRRIVNYRKSRSFIARFLPPFRSFPPPSPPHVTHEPPLKSTARPEIKVVFHFEGVVLAGDTSKMRDVIEG